MRKKAMIILTALLLLVSSSSVVSAVSAEYVVVYSGMKLFFNGVEDTNGDDGKIQVGEEMIPKVFFYRDTTYIPLRYFANQLGIDNVGWDSEQLLIWVNSDKPQRDQASINREPQTTILNVRTDSQYTTTISYPRGKFSHYADL